MLEDQTSPDDAPWETSVANLIFDAPRPGEGREPAIARVSAIIAEHCLPHAWLDLVKAAVHCDWLSDDERVEIAQELTAADNMAACATILSRWDVAFRDGELIDLNGEAAA